MGIVLGSVLQDSMIQPVIAAQGTTLVEQSSIIHNQREALLLYMNEIAFFQDEIAELRETQESNNNFIMKIEDFYKIDLTEAKKGGSQKLQKLVAERAKEYRGMGGGE